MTIGMRSNSFRNEVELPLFAVQYQKVKLCKADDTVAWPRLAWVQGEPLEAGEPIDCTLQDLEGNWSKLHFEAGMVRPCL